MLVSADKYCSRTAGEKLTFMMRSGRKVPTPAIPMPDLAVPYAAPAPVKLETTWSAFVILIKMSSWKSGEPYCQRSWRLRCRPGKREHC